jgi:hypothetical protein
VGVSPQRSWAAAAHSNAVGGGRKKDEKPIKKLTVTEGRRGLNKTEKEVAVRDAQKGGGLLVCTAAIEVDPSITDSS